MSVKKISQSRIKGSLMISEFEFGQTLISFVGGLEAEERTLENKGNLTPFMKKKMGKGNTGKGGMMQLASMAVLPSLPSSSKGNLTQTFTSTKRVFCTEVESQFHQPKVIDERRRRHFVKTIMPHAPTLTAQEDSMIERRLAMVKDTFDAKRYGSIKDDVAKFIHINKSTGAVFGVSECIIDAPASSVLAEVATIDTYAASRQHRRKNGNLPRKLWNGIDGTRSQQYSVGKKLPSPLEPRLFEGWRCWKRVTNPNKTVSFIFAITPMKEYHKEPRKVAEKTTDKPFELGTSTGIYIVTEVSPRVCSLLRIQHADLKGNAGSKLPTQILTLFTKRE
ncbi:hypothetical protein TrRE_jg5433, partial [Triparma retinervis]